MEEDMKKTAKFLGYAGLLPFVSIPILVMIGLVDAYLGYLHFIQYSAIILSFFGGIHWLDALQNRRKNHQLFVSMLPSVVAWLALMFLDGTMLLSVLSISYVGILLYDKYVLALEKDILVDYMTMRILLTTVVVMSHLLMAFN
ncbi:MAG: hypothetical protein ACJAVV_002685 [Alphaproteobacteria bacterium]